MSRRLFIVSPTESCLTRRGDRHPKLAARFAAQGWNVCYISSDFYHAEKHHFSTEEIAAARERAGYELKLFHVPAYGDNISFSRWWGYVWLALRCFFFLLPRIRGADVLLVPCRPPEILLAGRLLKLLRQNVLIMDVRDIWPDGLPLRSTFIHRLFALYCRLLNRLAASGADFTFYTAKGFLPWLLRYIHHDKTQFIPLGFDERRWQESRPLTFADFPDGVIRLVFVGDLAKSMEIAPLVRAVAANHRYSLTFIGGGERLEDIRTLAREINADNITFTGRMTPEAVTRTIRGQHISVIPLKVKFSMPNKLFDALGARRPLLVYGHNDAADFALEEKIGWQLNFDAGEEVGFLNSLQPEEVIAASIRVDHIRMAYSKEYLYQQMVQKINQISHFTSQKESEKQI